MWFMFSVLSRFKHFKFRDYALYKKSVFFSLLMVYLIWFKIESNIISEKSLKLIVQVLVSVGQISVPQKNQDNFKDFCRHFEFSLKKGFWLRRKLHGSDRFISTSDELILTIKKALGTEIEPLPLLVIKVAAS